MIIADVISYPVSITRVSKFLTEGKEEFFRYHVKIVDVETEAFSKKKLEVGSTYKCSGILINHPERGEGDIAISITDCSLDPDYVLGSRRSYISSTILYGFRISSNIVYDRGQRGDISHYFEVTSEDRGVTIPVLFYTKNENKFRFNENDKLLIYGSLCLYNGLLTVKSHTIMRE